MFSIDLYRLNLTGYSKLVKCDFGYGPIVWLQCDRMNRKYKYIDVDGLVYLRSELLYNPTSVGATNLCCLYETHDRWVVPILFQNLVEGNKPDQIFELKENSFKILDIGEFKSKQLTLRKPIHYRTNKLGWAEPNARQNSQES